MATLRTLIFVVSSFRIATNTVVYSADGGLRPYVRSADVLAALVAAAVHDLDHTGWTNGFEEHSALTRTFAMLRDPDCDFLASCTREQRAEFRRSVIALVLATDMSRHLETVSAWKALLVTETLEAAGADVEAEGMRGGRRGEEADDEGRGRADSEGPPTMRAPSPTAAAAAAAPAATPSSIAAAVPPPLSNFPRAGRGHRERGRPFATHERWARRIVEEFGAQGDEERRLGLPVSPLCDRSESLARAQEGFLTFLAHAERHLAHWSALAAAERDAAAGAERLAEAAAP
eukprot:tig00020892_g14906.t1